MSEQDLRDGLWAAVADEPALAFDPDAVISKARHAIRRRRALVGAGAATAAVAVAAVAVPTVIGAPRGWFGSAGPGTGDGESCASLSPSLEEPPSFTELPSLTEPPSFSALPPPGVSLPSAPPSSAYKLTVPSPGATPTASLVPMPTASYPPPGPDVPEPTPSPDPCPPSFSGPPPPPVSSAPGAPDPRLSQWPPAKITPARYTADQLRTRGAEMQAHLQEQFATIVPGATEVHAGPFGGEAAGAVADGQGYLEGFTGFTLNKERSAVDIYVAAPGATEATGPQEACAPGCKIVEARPDGGLVTVKIEDLDDGGQVMTVTHYRSNGTVVRATGYNYDPTTSVPPKYAPAIPVSVEQLTALATDPKLAL